MRGPVRKPVRGLVGRLPLTLVAAVSAALLTACATMPTDGPVVEGRSGAEDLAGLSVIAPEPARGASPLQIVQGFVNAAVATELSGGTERAYTTARSFLTSRRAASWQPDAGTVVYTGASPDYDVADAGAVPGPDGAQADGPDADRAVVTVSVGVAGTIDPGGRWTAAPPGTTRETTMTVVREDGQWRVDEVPDGVLVAESYLGLTYSAHDLHFLEPTRQLMVRETRWFPRRASNATVLTRELLAGPSPWLSGAVVNAFPEGTRLAPPGSVRIEDGVASVDLTAEALDASPDRRALMLGQLRATLLPVSGVDDVVITVNGGPIEVPVVPAGLSAEAPVDPRAVALAGDTIVLGAVGGAVEPVPDLPSLAGLGPSHPAVSHPRQLVEVPERRFAVLTAQRSQLRVLARGEVEVPPPSVTAADLTLPSFDPYGWVWTAAAVSDGSVAAVGPDGGVSRVSAPWLAGERVSSLRLSRDGARALVTSTAPDGRGRVRVAGVVRDDDLVPTALSPEGPLVVAPHLEVVQEAAWLAPGQAAVLGRSVDGSDVRVHLLRIGSPSMSSLSHAPGAVGLAGGNGPGSVLVWTVDGVLEQAGATWVPARGLGGARQVSYPG
ncbi:LpqB family beta-propeller domain-containing protein [Thalassiella azotivora]